MLVLIRHTLSSPILQYWLTLCCRLWWVGCGGEGDLSGEGGWCWCHYRCVIARLHSLQDLPTTGSTEHSETLWKISKQPVTIIVFECFKTILVFSILRFSLELCQKCKKKNKSYFEIVLYIQCLLMCESNRVLHFSFIAWWP